MAETPDVPEEAADEKILAQLDTETPSALREFAVAIHEMYSELKEVGFPAPVLNQIMAVVLADVATGRIFELSPDDEDDDWDDEGDFDNDGDDPK